MYPKSQDNKRMMEWKTAKEWLEQIDDDPRGTWLLPYQDELLRVIRHELFDREVTRHVFDLLVLVSPIFGQLYLPKSEWRYLIIAAIRQAEKLRYPADRIEVSAQIFQLLGADHLYKGKIDSARAMFDLALEHAKRGDSISATVAAYTGVFRLQWFSLQDEFTPEIIRDVLEMADRLSDKRIKIKLYDALAYGCAVMGNIESALEYAQMGLAFANVLADDTEKARLALTIGVVYETANVMSGAKHYLERAQKLLEYARSLVKSPLISWKDFPFLFQEGVNLHQMGDSRSAEEVLSRALAEARLLDRVDWIMATKHALALSKTKLGKYDEARAHLEEAIAYWREIGNALETASALQELGNIENLSGNRAAARHYLFEAQTICQSVAPNPRQELIMNLIIETINEVVVN